MGPWNGNTDDPIGEFPVLGPLQDDMKEIYRLFNNENEVYQCIEKLIENLDLTSVDTFRKSLLDLETKNGFSHDVVTSKKTFSSLDFLSYVGAKRPILDLAFQDDNHGCSTHRIQFMIIEMWRQSTKKINKPACDIYAAMATALKAGAQPNNDGNYKFEDVAWNYYFDQNPVAIGMNNACRPDYLCGKFIADKFPKLAEVAK